MPPTSNRHHIPRAADINRNQNRSPVRIPPSAPCSSIVPTHRSGHARSYHRSRGKTGTYAARTIHHIPHSFTCCVFQQVVPGPKSIPTRKAMGFEVSTSSPHRPFLRNAAFWRVMLTLVSLTDLQSWPRRAGCTGCISLESLESSVPQYLDINGLGLTRACRRANRNLTHSEWEQFFGDQPYQTTCPDMAGPAAE